MDMIYQDPIKVYFEGPDGREVRKFKLSSVCNLTAIRNTLVQLFPAIDSPDSVNIYYQDEDKDLILIGTDEELAFAINELKAKGESLKIYAAPKCIKLEQNMAATMPTSAQSGISPGLGSASSEGVPSPSTSFVENRTNMVGVEGFKKSEKLVTVEKASRPSAADQETHEDIEGMLQLLASLQNSKSPKGPTKRGKTSELEKLIKKFGGLENPWVPKDHTRQEKPGAEGSSKQAALNLCDKAVESDARKTEESADEWKKGKKEHRHSKRVHRRRDIPDEWVTFGKKYGRRHFRHCDSGNTGECGMSAPDSTQEPQLHDGIICDGCDGEIRGFRYKCLQCVDYDLCADCEGLGHHSNHIMIRMPTPIIDTYGMVKQMRRMLHQKRFLQSIVHPVFRNVHAEFTNECASSSAEDTPTGRNFEAPRHHRERAFRFEDEVTRRIITAVDCIKDCILSVKDISSSRGGYQRTRNQTESCQQASSSAAAAPCSAADSSSATSASPSSATGASTTTAFSVPQPEASQAHPNQPQSSASNDRAGSSVQNNSGNTAFRHTSQRYTATPTTTTKSLPTAGSSVPPDPLASMVDFLSSSFQSLTTAANHLQPNASASLHSNSFASCSKSKEDVPNDVNDKRKTAPILTSRPTPSVKQEDLNAALHALYEMGFSDRDGNLAEMLVENRLVIAKVVEKILAKRIDDALP